MTRKRRNISLEKLPKVIIYKKIKIEDFELLYQKPKIETGHYDRVEHYEKGVKTKMDINRECVSVF